MKPLALCLCLHTTAPLVTYVEPVCVEKVVLYKGLLIRVRTCSTHVVRPSERLGL